VVESTGLFTDAEKAKLKSYPHSGSPCLDLASNPGGIGDPPPPAGFAIGLAPHLQPIEDADVDVDAQAWRLTTVERRRIALMLAISFALTTLSVRGVVGKRLSLHLETISVVTIGALVATAALLYLRSRLGARTE